MRKQFSTLAGIVLILIGIVALIFNQAMRALGIGVWHWTPWRLWPMIVVSVGLVFCLPPLLFRKRGLAGLFIPGVPILTTGCILLLASTFNWWGIWSWLWPLEVLAVATGFALAALYMQVIWLLIPAIIVGANGLMFLFCAITGLWESWAVLWPVEPLSVGLSLLLIGTLKKIKGLILAGLIVSGIAGVALVGMTTILSMNVMATAWRTLTLIGPALLIIIGLLLLVSSLARHPRVAPPPVEGELYKLGKN